MTSTESVLIGRPVVDMFACVVDVRCQPRWDRDIDAVLGAAELDFGVGREYRVRFAPFLSDTQGTLTVVGAVPDVRVVIGYDFAGRICTMTSTDLAEGNALA